MNGTWIAHGLAGVPNAEVSLTISGNNHINSTFWLMEPTIIASNSTMFQISLLADNSNNPAVTPATVLQSTGPWNTSPNAKTRRNARATHRPHR